MFLEMFVTVMLVSAGTPGSDNMAIHCSHLGHGPTLLSWCPRLFLSETHTLRSGVRRLPRHGAITVVGDTHVSLGHSPWHTLISGTRLSLDMR